MGGLAAVVQVSAGQAEPAGARAAAKEGTIRQGACILLEAPGVEQLRFCDAAEGGGDAGIALLPGNAGIGGVELAGLVVFTLRNCGEDGLRLPGQGNILPGGIDARAAVMAQQPVEDGSVLLLLGGGEAEGVGDDVQAGGFHCFSGGKVLPAGLGFALKSAAEAGIGAAG